MNRMGWKQIITDNESLPEEKKTYVVSISLG